MAKLVRGRKVQGVGWIGRSASNKHDVLIGTKLVEHMGDPEKVALFVADEGDHWQILLVKMTHIVDDYGVIREGVKPGSYIPADLARANSLGTVRRLRRYPTELLDFLCPGDKWTVTNWTTGGAYFEVEKKANV